MFHDSSIDVKKMIASYMINKVTVSRDYNVDVELNLTEQEYMGGFKLVM